MNAYFLLPPPPFDYEKVILMIDNAHKFSEENWVLLEKVCSILRNMSGSESEENGIAMNRFSNHTNSKILFAHRMFAVILSMRQYDFSSDPNMVYHILETPRSHSLSINLSSLSKKDTKELLCHLCDGFAISDELNEIVYERCKGNPMFTIEFVHKLREKNMIVLEEFATLSSEVEGTKIDLPHTIKEIFQADWDQMDIISQTVLQVMSVFGVPIDPVWLIEIPLLQKKLHPLVNSAKGLNKGRLQSQNMNRSVIQHINTTESQFGYREALTHRGSIVSILGDEEKAYDVFVVMLDIIEKAMERLVDLGFLQHTQEKPKSHLSAQSSVRENFDGPVVTLVEPFQQQMKESEPARAMTLRQRIEYLSCQSESPKILFNFTSKDFASIAYSSLLGVDRNQLHNEVSRWYETMLFRYIKSVENMNYDTQIDQLVELQVSVAKHAKKAGELVRTIQFFENIAKLAEKSNANISLQYYKKCIELADQLESVIKMKETERILKRTETQPSSLKTQKTNLKYFTFHEALSSRLKSRKISSVSNSNHPSHSSLDAWKSLPSQNFQGLFNVKDLKAKWHAQRGLLYHSMGSTQHALEELSLSVSMLEISGLKRTSLSFKQCLHSGTQCRCKTQSVHVFPLSMSALAEMDGQAITIPWQDHEMTLLHTKAHQVNCKFNDELSLRSQLRSEKKKVEFAIEASRRSFLKQSQNALRTLPS